MKRKRALLIPFAGVIAAVVFVGIHFQEEQASLLTSSEQVTNTTSASTSEEILSTRKTTTAKKVKVYVDPALYDTAVESAADYVDVRETTSSDSTVLTKLHRGEWATWLATEGDYVKVRADSGKEGYIPKENAQIKEVTQTEAPRTLSELQIVLDAGHGGIDSGAVSPDESVYEKDLTLKTVKAVGKLLAANGVQVTYTRDSDKMLELSDIVELSEAAQPDVFLSFHYDNFDTDNGWQGFTTYRYYQEGEALADLVSEDLGAEIGLSNNGVRTGNYYVIRENNQPVSLLLELGYLNSDTDLPQITQADFPDKVAQGILTALTNYVAQNKA